MADFAAAAIPALVLTAALGIIMAAALAKRHGTAWNVPSALLAMYVLVIPVSGVVHLLRLNGASRGFYDVYAQAQPHISSALTTSVLIAFGGLLALWFGTMLVRPTRPSQAVTKESVSVSPRAWAIAGLLLLPVSYLALAQVQTLRSAVESTRVWGFDGGNARLVFLANWLPWAITFIAMAVAVKIRSKLGLVLLGGVTTYAIFLATDWSGARSLILLFAFPFLVWIFPRIGRWRILALAGLAGGVVWAVVAGTLERTATFQVQEVNLPGIVDWEWGRFSMTTFGVEYVQLNGMVFGETYISSVLQIPIAVVNLLGGGIDLDLRYVSQVTSAELLGSETLNYTVPGAVAEAYINFGAFGVCALMVMLGALATWLDSAARRADNASTQLLLSYLIAILLFRSLVAESASLLTFIAFTGLPLLIMAALHRRRQGDLHREEFPMRSIGQRSGL